MFVISFLLLSKDPLHECRDSITAIHHSITCIIKLEFFLICTVRPVKATCSNPPIGKVVAAEEEIHRH